MAQIISWKNKYSGETGYVACIDSVNKHFINTSDAECAKRFANAGLARIAVNSLIKYGEAKNNEFSILSV